MATKAVPPWWRRSRLLPLVLVLLALTLRLHHLGYKGLWGDEIAQVRRASIPLSRIIQEYRTPPRYFLQFALIHLTRQVGTSDFWSRLPSALASTLAVAVAYATGRRLAGGRTAVMAMLFMAVAPFQVWYAQDARMYGALTLYALLSLYFFLRLLHRPDVKALGGYILANALLVYNHLFGFLALGNQVVIAMGLVVWDWHTRRRAPFAQKRATELCCLRAWFRPWLVGLAVVGVLALPLLPGTLPFLLRGGLREPGVEWRTLPPFQLTPSFLLELLGYFGLNAGADWRMLVSVGLALSGLLALGRSKPRAAWCALAWLTVPLATLSLARPQHEVVPRYLIFMQPIYLMLMAQGALAVGAAARALVARRCGEKAGNGQKVVTYGMGALGLILFLAMVVPPLEALYRRAKINDWRAVADYMRAQAKAGDLIGVERDTWGVRALTYYWQPPPNIRVQGRGVQALERARQQGERVWYLSLGGYFDPEGERWAREHLTPLDSREWERPDLVYHPHDGFVFPQSEASVTIYRTMP